jgi:N-formylglutamate deformylase
MPSSSLLREEDSKADFVLGDRFGTSCTPALIAAFEYHLHARGFRTLRNKPYAGGFITEHYGNQAAGLHSIQIEVNRALYMDERRYQRIESFDRLAADIMALPDRLAMIPLEELKPYRAAAE